MNCEAAQRASWANPSDKMIVALALRIEALLEKVKQWQAEHPDEVRALALKNQPLATEAARKWKKENPEEFRLSLIVPLAAAAEWKATHSEEMSAMRADWHKRNPEKSAATISAMAGGFLKALEAEPERFNELRSRAHEACREAWKRNPEKMHLQRAAAQRSSVRKKIDKANAKYTQLGERLRAVFPRTETGLTPREFAALIFSLDETLPYANQGPVRSNLRKLGFIRMTGKLNAARYFLVEKAAL